MQCMSYIKGLNKVIVHLSLVNGQYLMTSDQSPMTDLCCDKMGIRYEKEKVYEKELEQ